jgi:glucose uptake protein
MFIVHDSTLAILLCVVTMLGWGSWANTQKLAGKEKWPFQLYYWDYAIGVLLFSILFAATAGSIGTGGQSAWANLAAASATATGVAMFSGALFNLSNVLLVVAIDAAGMSVAFPLGVGLALVIGTVTSYIATPHGNPIYLSIGVALVVFAMLFSAAASSSMNKAAKLTSLRGILFAIAAGCLMGLFYPQLISSMSPDFNVIAPGKLTPYTAAVLFALGLFLSNFIINTVFLRLANLTYADYFRGSGKLHSLGILGGAIWMLALSVNVLASGVAGPAVSYALGQGATLIAAIWGVFIWREFQRAPKRSLTWITLMFLCYTSGLILVGLAIL